MIPNHADIDVFIGIDVGKHNHHPVALDRDGKQLLSKAVLQINPTDNSVRLTGEALAALWSNQVRKLRHMMIQTVATASSVPTVTHN